MRMSQSDDYIARLAARVEDARRAVFRQEEIVARLNSLGDYAPLHERLLRTLRTSLKLFEEHLRDLQRRRI